MAVTKLFYIGSELASAPPYTKRFFVDTSGKRAYLSMGTSASADWSEIQMTQRSASAFTTSQTLVVGDNGKILVFSGASLAVTLPASSTLTAGWKVSIVNENAFVSQSDSATLHTTTSATTPLGQRNLLIKRAGTDKVNGVATEFQGVSLVCPPRECVDIWYTSSGQFEASPSTTVGWKDLPKSPSTLGANAKDPIESTIDSSFMRALEFTDANSGSEKEVYYSLHLNHDYVLGTKVYPHVHWNSGNTTAGSLIGWVWIYSAVKGHSQQAMNTTGTTIKASTKLSGTPYMHYVTEVADADAIPPTNLEPDTNIYFKLFRDSAGANNTGDNCTTSAWLTFVDAHYLSTDGGTPLKAPPFYL